MRKFTILLTIKTKRWRRMVKFHAVLWQLYISKTHNTYSVVMRLWVPVRFLFFFKFVSKFRTIIIDVLLLAWCLFHIFHRKITTKYKSSNYFIFHFSFLFAFFLSLHLTPFQDLMEFTWTKFCWCQKCRPDFSQFIVSLTIKTNSTKEWLCCTWIDESFAFFTKLFD